MNKYINNPFNGTKRKGCSGDEAYTDEYVQWLESEILSLQSRLASIMTAKNALQRQIDSYKRESYHNDDYDCYVSYPEEDFDR